MVTSFTERELQEYQKTARCVAKGPWNLLKAQQYLERLCDANMNGDMQRPPKLEFIFNQGRLKRMMQSTGLPMLHQEDMRPVRMVKALLPDSKERAVRAKREKLLKRPAAAPTPVLGGPGAPKMCYSLFSFYSILFTFFCGVTSFLQLSISFH